MDSTISYLSSEKYGYDFVVATTEASINSNLRQFLAEESQPVQYICFLADPQTGNPITQISLEDLLERTNGVNPFDIPSDTPYNTPEIAALTKALFVVGVQIQMGLPPGILPKDLPPVISLGGSATNVLFNLLCSQIVVIQNSPPSGFGGTGAWNVWSQPYNDPWYVQVSVDLKVADLDKELDTNYLNNHPDIQAQLRNALLNISGSAFSLQQLIFDMDSAVLETALTFKGVPPGSNAEIMLQKSFVSIYAKNAKEYGLPLVNVSAVSQYADDSSLALTAFERIVSPLRDHSGVIAKPTKTQQEATTLDYLCAANNDSLPAPASFDWNWVQPEDIGNESGVIAINRNALAKYFLGQLISFAKPACIKATCTVNCECYGDATYEWTLTAGQTPQTAKVTDSGSTVAHMEYTSTGWDEAKAWPTYAAMQITPTYTCDVVFEGDTIVITQHLVIYIYVRWDDTDDGCNAYDVTLVDNYALSVDQYGGLQLSNTGNSVQDNSQDPDVSGIVNFFTGIGDLLNDIKSTVVNFAATEFTDVGVNSIQNFVFPGAKVFTYKEAAFSQYQDLVCKITYVDPLENVQLARAKMLAEKAPKALISRHAANIGPILALHSSTELMQNYVQGEIVSPTGKFEAVQTSDGLALLFAIDTSGVFHVIEEKTGSLSTGWQVQDLSTAIIKENFPTSSNAVVSTFDVGQSALNGGINLAMSVRSDGSDHLFVSLNNYSADTSWTENPKWRYIQFDAIGERPKSIAITGTLFAETMSGGQYLVVDIDRLSGASVKDICRYYIDTTSLTGPYWVKHDVPIDIEAGSYQSCAGRIFNGYVDGIYTAGTSGGAAQFIYEPVLNVFGDGPPAPVRLALPGRTIPSAIATVRIVDKKSTLYTSTDLYAISGSTLYRFAADKHRESPQALITNDFLSATDTLLGMSHDGVTTLWGKNGSDDVYYVSCPTSQLALPASWSAPVPILTGIERISAFVNRFDGGNTIFASGNGKLEKIIQATSAAGKVWRAMPITLSAPPQEKSLAFKSYTTTIHVTDEDNLPVKDVCLAISANTRTPVYINGLYYVLGGTAVKVPTDATGSVTVIEATEDINAAILTVSIDGAAATSTINPMHNAFDKITALNSTEKLRNASFPSETCAGGVVGSPGSTPLVDPSTASKDLDTIATHMDNLNKAYSNAKETKPTTFASLNNGVIPATLFQGSPNLPGKESFAGLFDDIAIAAGDLYRWLKSGVKAVIDILYDAASNAWHFIAKIAGKVYRAILDTVDAIVGALEWVFKAIKTLIEDIIRFVEFLFEWDDIGRTKGVIHNVVKLWLQDQVDGIPRAKDEFDGEIVEVEKTLNQWASITDWSPLGDVAKQPPAGSASNPAEGQTSGSQLLAHHFRNNAKDLVIVGGDPSLDVLDTLVNELLTAISNEGEVLGAVYTQLQELASNFHSMTVEDVLKRLAVILVDGVLSSVQVVVDALLDVLYDLASSAVTLLDSKIHIPIISDILNAIGISDISFLDLFTWIAAVGYTVVYKIVNDKAPFSDNSEVQSIISATSWSQLTDLFSSDAISSAYSTTETPSGLVTISEYLGSCIFVSSHSIAGFLIFTGNFINTFEAEAETGDNPFSIPSAIIGIISAASAGAGDALVPKDAVENQAVSILSKITTGAVIVSKIIFSGPAQKKFGAGGSKFAPLAVNDGRATGAIVNTILVIPALFVTGWHFYELSCKPAGATRSAAIVNEVANLTSYVSRVAYAVAVNDEEPDSRQVPIGIMVVSNVATAGLHTAVAIIN